VVEARTRESEAKRLETDYNSRWEAAENRAKAIFPDLSDPQSPMLARMAELDAEAKASDPALYHDPGKFLELALRAAEQLRASSPNALTSASTTASAIPARQPAARGVIVGQSARATTPAPARPRVAEEIDAVMSVDEMEDLNLRLGIR
jgi:hypothetical protein